MSGSSTRLCVLLARESDVAVILRCGPSKQVLVIRWHRTTDAFFPGQWFKGRIYEHQCDLSPSGERLLYYAATYKPPFDCWTAVSRPPFLTALALWPRGVTFAGGGQFQTESKVLLSLHPEAIEPVEPFRLPNSIFVDRWERRPEWGVPGYLQEATLQRDGWSLADPGKAVGRNAPSWWRFDPPEVWAKRNPASGTLALRIRLHGYYREEGPSRVTDSAVVSESGTVLDLGETDWVDWDRNGDLLYSQGPFLYRRRLEAGTLTDARCLLDAAGFRFRPLEPTPQARDWFEPLGLEAAPEPASDR